MLELTALNSLALLGFGAAIGLLGSALGVGGGIFMVPFLVLVFDLPIHQAVAAVNVERGLANIRLGIALEVTTALGSVAGALLANRLSGPAVQFLFGLTLLPVSVLMFLKGRRALRQPPAAAGERAAKSSSFDAAFYDPAAGGRTNYAVRNVAPASGISFFAGSLSGLLGIGGGVVQVPVMNLLCGVPMKAAAATSNFIIGVSAAASAFVYFRRGLMPLELTGVIVTGVLLGSFLGIYVLYKARSEKLQLIFSALTLLVGLKMLFGVL